MKKIKLKRTSILWLSMLLIILAKSDALIISMQLPINNMVFFTIWHILPIVFVLNFSILFSIRRKPIFLFVIDFAISFIFFVDMIYARGYGHLISVYMIFAKGITEGMGPSVISLIHPTDFLMFVDLPFVFLAVFKLRENNGLALPKRIALFASTMLLTTALFGYQLYQMRDIKVLANYTNRPLYLSPIGTHIFDIYRFVYERNEKLNSKEVAEVDAWLKDNSKYQQPDPAYKYLEGKIKGKNLIVIQVESLESVVLNKSYYNQEITPNLNKLIGKSIYFSNINEQVKDGNSSDAELIFNTSTYPISSGSAFIRFGDNTYNSIPKLLNNYGYSSVAMHGDDKKFWNRDMVFKALGFKEYITEEQFNYKKQEGMGILDEGLFNEAVNEMGTLKQPYNLFLITLTSHMPFVLSDNLKTLNLPTQDETSNYLQCIHYTDKVFGDFYKKIEEKGYLNNSVIVIYGDHEGIHKYYPTTLPDNNKKIPFIVYIPGEVGIVIDKVGGQVDMMPTLAYLLGIDIKKYDTTVMGRNLFGSSSGMAILSTGDILGKPDDVEHLDEVQTVADNIIKGNYYQQNEKSLTSSK